MVRQGRTARLPDGRRALCALARSRSVKALVKRRTTPEDVPYKGGTQATARGIRGRRTIVQVTPGGRRTLFASISGLLPGPCPGGVGLTTAVAVLPGGWVVVGSTPSSNGMAATARAGCLIVLGPRGRVRETIAGHGINGPWDATAASFGSYSDLFVTNVLNGTVAGRGAVVRRGTVLRLRLSLSSRRPPRLTSAVTIGRIVETRPSGTQVATRLLDSSGHPAGAGALFGLAVAPGGRGVYYVDDAANTLRLLH